MMRNTFGARIRDFRIRAGLTQKSLACLMGVSPQAACKWEKDLACPDIMTLPRLSQILGISLDELFAPELERIHEENIAYDFGAYVRKVI